MLTNTTFNNIALIVAGGSGKRMSSDIPKQYIEISGKTILRFCIETFLAHPAIDAVAVVISESHKQLYEQATQGLNLLPCVTGGQERQDSVRNGLRALEKYNPQIVLIHDAARIFTTANLIDRLLEQIKTCEAAIPAIPVSDTVKKVDDDMCVTTTIPRESLYLVQTPQVFKFDTILDAHEELAGQYYTDDASLLEQKDLAVNIVKGDNKNFKITSEYELELARSLIKTR